MGKFTTDYKVSYSNGTSQTENRLDMGKMMGNGFMPFLLIILAIIALISAIPFIMLIPLFLYLKTPFDEVRKLVKNDENVKNYTDEILKEKGFENFNALFVNTKKKFYVLILLCLAALALVEFIFFQVGFSKGKFTEIILRMASISSPLLILYPLGFAIMTKNRQVLFVLLEKEETRIQRLFSSIFKQKKVENENVKKDVIESKSESIKEDVPKTTSSYKKKIQVSLFTILAVFAIIHQSMNILAVYTQNKNMETRDIFFKMTYTSITNKDDMFDIKKSLEENSIEMDDYYLGNQLLYGLYKNLGSVYSDSFEFESHLRMLKPVTFIEGIITNDIYGKYNKNYKRTLNMLDVFIELGGDKMQLYHSKSYPLYAKTSTVDAYFALKEKGLIIDERFKDLIFIQVAKKLDRHDEGYSKKLALMAKELITSKYMAEEIIELLGADLKRSNQLSVLKVLNKVANKK